MALESYLQERNDAGTAYDLAKTAGLIGRMRRGPRDLSTNKEYFEGFGKD
jgi:hypothetical protein